MPDKNVVEEVLEFIWYEKEKGIDSIKELLSVDEVIKAGARTETLVEMEGDGLVSISGDTITLTPAGLKEAESVIRRHRLAEVLLSDVLEIDEKIIEEQACSFEHYLSPVVTESICTLLGHPPVCPHGLTIPRGECCRTPRDSIAPLVVPLTNLDVGEKGRIIFMAPSSHARLDKLGSLGLVPGSIVRLHQKKPAYVIEIGETTLALDPAIVKEIYVRRAV